MSSTNRIRSARVMKPHSPPWATFIGKNSLISDRLSADFWAGRKKGKRNGPSGSAISQVPRDAAVSRPTALMIALENHAGEESDARGNQQRAYRPVANLGFHCFAQLHCF